MAKPRKPRTRPTFVDGGSHWLMSPALEPEQGDLISNIVPDGIMYMKRIVGGEVIQNGGAVRIKYLPLPNGHPMGGEFDLKGYQGICRFPPFDSFEGALAELDILLLHAIHERWGRRWILTMLAELEANKKKIKNSPEYKAAMKEAKKKKNESTPKE